MFPTSSLLPPNSITVGKVSAYWKWIYFRNGIISQSFFNCHVKLKSLCFFVSSWYNLACKLCKYKTETLLTVQNWDLVPKNTFELCKRQTRKKGLACNISNPVENLSIGDLGESHSRKLAIKPGGENKMLLKVIPPGGSFNGIDHWRSQIAQTGFLGHRLVDDAGNPLFVTLGKEIGPCIGRESQFLKFSMA